MSQIQIGSDGIGRAGPIFISRFFTHTFLVSRPSIQAIFGVIHGLQRPAMLTRRGTRLRSETHLGGKRKARTVRNGWSAYWVRVFLSFRRRKGQYARPARAQAATVHRFLALLLHNSNLLRSPMASPSKGTGMEEHVIYLRHISSLATIVSFLPTCHVMKILCSNSNWFSHSYSFFPHFHSPRFLITADWLVVDKSRDSQTITTMTEEAAHNHHVVSKCLDPEVSFLVKRTK